MTSDKPVFQRMSDSGYYGWRLYSDGRWQHYDIHYDGHGNDGWADVRNVPAHVAAAAVQAAQKKVE